MGTRCVEERRASSQKVLSRTMGTKKPPWQRKGLHHPLAAEKEAIPSTSSFGLLDGVQRCHHLEV